MTIKYFKNNKYCGKNNTNAWYVHCTAQFMKDTELSRLSAVNVLYSIRYCELFVAWPKITRRGNTELVRGLDTQDFLAQEHSKRSGT